MTRIYLIRHAEAEGNLYRRAQGWYDGRITENGYLQIEALKKRFEDIHIDAVYSSDLFRTRVTAAAVYKPKNLPLNLDPQLREIKIGEWEDRTWGDLARNDLEQLELFNIDSPEWNVPGSESFAQVSERVGNALKRIACLHEGQTVAVFSHSAAIRSTLARFRKLSQEEVGQGQQSDNTAVTLLEFDGEEPKIIFQNDNSHLDDRISTFARQNRWKAYYKGIKYPSFWFRPMDMERESQDYLNARREAWQTIHGSMRRYNGEGFLAVAQANSRYNPDSVVRAMLEDKPAGLLQMDFERDAEKKIGWIPFFYLEPEYRSMKMGGQLLGQAQSSFRKLGRDKLRLRCAPHNEIAQRFYLDHGFYKVGEEPGGRGVLDILEKYIGYEERV